MPDQSQPYDAVILSSPLMTRNALRMPKWLVKLSIVLLTIYAIAMGSLYFIQDDIILRPDRLPESHEFRMGQEVEVSVDQHISLNCLYLTEPRSQGVVLYLHGNRGSNRRCLRQARSFVGNRLDLFMPDYRGYGKSDGVMHNQKQAYRDVQKVYDFLLESYAEDQITIVGYSLGSAMASHLAATNNPARLVLVAPFYSIIDLKNRRLPIVPSFLIKYPFRNNRSLKKVRCKTEIYHGKDDELIPFSSSERLQRLAPKRIRLVPLENCGHRGAIFHPDLQRGFSAFVGD